jgi:hypothetical protein
MILIFLFSLLTNLYATSYCEYSYTVWNNLQKKSEGPFTIRKHISDVKPIERDPGGCTLCKSDQIEISLSNGVKFEVCKKEAGRIQSSLEKALREGVIIKTVVGYRPSMSKGALDARGRRTEFSRHAFGIAVDINEAHNGLYDQCLKWGPSCRLIKGGTYLPGKPLSLTSDSVLVNIFKSSGLKWGGEIEGYQKDFMHFSPDGL